MPATSPIEADLIEVFSSIQGEGVLIGCRQVFVRFADCNLSCAYCDTTFQADATYGREVSPGSGRFRRCANPANLHDLTTFLAGWRAEQPDLHHSLCLTGGEPLLHADILARWLPAIADDWPIYLETNGTLPHELTKIMPFVSWVSMDMKTVETTGQATDWDAHATFIRIAANRLVQLKLVVSRQTSVADVRRAAEFAALQQIAVPLILQPVTTKGRVAIDGATLLELQAAAAAVYPDTRLVPQVHPFLGIS